MSPNVKALPLAHALSWRRGAASIGVLLLLGACGGGGDDPSIHSAALPRVVLQAGDLTGPFTQFDGGEQTERDLRPETAANPTRFGRVGGWKARYRRPGTPATEGPLVVESKVDLFESSEGADQDLASYVDELEFEEIEAPSIGEETVALTIRQQTLRFFTVAWRFRNTTASITASGFDRRLTLGHVTALGHKQQRRLERAAR
jgi:hypothetical protein